MSSKVEKTKSAKTNPKRAVHKREKHGTPDGILKRREYNRERKRKYDAKRRGNNPLPLFAQIPLKGAGLKLPFPTIKEVAAEYASELPPFIEFAKPNTPRPQPGKGLPADINPRGKRCCTWLKKRGKWCGKLAMVGTDYCARHNGDIEREVNQVGRLDRMPSIYGKTLKGTLAEAVQAMVNEPKEEQFNFREDLALVKHTAISAVALYNAAVESGKPETIASAGALLRDTLKEVVEYGDKVAKLEATGKDVITVHDMHFILNQMVAVVHKVLGGSPSGQQKAAEIEVEFRKSIMLPGSETVDADARVTETSNEVFAAMLSSVPVVPEEEETNA